MARKDRAKRTPFFVGQRSDRCGNGVLDVMDRTGRGHAKPPTHLTKDVITDPIAQRMEIRVLWELTCGAKLTFQRTRGPDKTGPLCFRIVEIDLTEA